MTQLLVVLALGAQGLAPAQESTGPATPAGPQSLRLSSYTMAVLAPQGPFGERAAWSYKLQDAKRKKKRGTIFLITGGSLVGLGLLSKAVEGEYSYGTFGISNATLLMVGGTAVGGYGVLARSRADREITALEAEGRQKGFTGLAPSGGVRLAFRVSF